MDAMNQKMRSGAFIVLLTGFTATASATTAAADFERGRALYEAHCEQCHTPNIHSRANKLPLTRDELAAIVDHFRRAAGLAWTPEEVDAVVDYLNRTRYRFAPR